MGINFLRWLGRISGFRWILYRSGGTNSLVSVLKANTAEAEMCGSPYANSDLWFMSLVGNCKFNYFAAQMTTHGAAWMLEVNSVVTLV